MAGVNKVVRNKGIGATLKLDVNSAINELKKLSAQMQKVSKSVENLKGKTISLSVDPESLKNLERTANTSAKRIAKSYAQSSKEIQNALSQNLTATPTSPDFLKRLRENMRQAEQIVSQSTRRMQNHVSSSLLVDGRTIGGVGRSVKESALINTGRMLTNVTTTRDNLATANALSAIGNAADAVKVGKIAQIGSALNTVGDAMDGIETAKIAQVGNALDAMDAVDTANLIRSANAVKEVGEMGDALNLAEMARNINVISKTDAFIKMADHAKMARDNVVSLGKSISSVGGVLQKIGSGLQKLGNGIQSYSNYMIKGFLALQYTMRGVIDAVIGGTSTLISDSTEQIKNLERATIGFENYFEKREKGFDAQVFLDRIKQESIIAQGVSAGDLASYVSQIAPVAASSDQSLDVTLGLLKAITYSGGSAATEMPNVVKNIRDVLAKGQAYTMDINQFNRAIPGLTNILQEMGLTQFLKNGQLSITKENVSQVMAALATLNSPDSPVYNILEKMSTTLGGLQERTRETIIQSVASSIEGSGLLDIWKGLLNNSELQTNIQKGIDAVVNSVANFLEDIDISHLITEVMNMVGMIGSYFGETVIPSLKELFGLDKGASVRDVVDSVIKLIGDFGKGLVNGIKYLLEGAKWIKENILPWLQKLGATLGIDGESLAQWAGFLVTAGPLLSKFVSAIGLAVSALGGLAIGAGKLLAKFAVHNSMEGLTTNHPLIGLLGNKFGGSLASLSFGGMLKGTGIMLTGKVLSSVVQTVLGGVEQPVARLGSALTESASVFLGLNTAFGPIPAVIGTVIDALSLFGRELQYQAEQRKKERIEAAAESFEGLKKIYLDTTIESMKKAGMYAEGDEATQQAYASIIEYLKSPDFNEFTDPNEALKRVMDKYRQVWSNWRTGDIVAEDIQEMLDPTSGKYITGTTKLSRENAEQYATQIRAIYDRMLELGFVGEYANDMSNVGAYDLWKHLNRSNITLGSTQFLEQVYANLNDPDWLTKTLTDKEVEVVYKAEGKEGQTLEDLLKENGFELHQSSLGGRGWYEADAKLKIYGDLDKTTQKILTDLGLGSADTLWNDSGIASGNAGLKTDPLTQVQTFSEAEGELKRIVSTYFPNISWEQWQKMDEEIKRKMLQMLGVLSGNVPFKSTGGYIRPVYRATGGYEKGVDTVPAMLAPGEYVQRSSAVSLAGLGVMDALNNGDLAKAYNLLGAKLTHNINTTNYGAVSNSDSHNRTINYITQIFRNRSGEIGGLRKLGAMMASRH